ncbi:hypothetical protein R1X32_04740 (plasmid) [Rhodococcus opacus]|nr:hypothetical protein [Rhodococcus opacus]MDV7087692.1 hypothetical protein [Rhodococcus opacus]
MGSFTAVEKPASVLLTATSLLAATRIRGSAGNGPQTVTTRDG